MLTTITTLFRPRIPLALLNNLPQTSLSYHTTPILLVKKKKRRTWDTIGEGQNRIVDNFGNETQAAAPITTSQKKLKESLFTLVDESTAAKNFIAGGGVTDALSLSSRVVGLKRKSKAPESLRQIRMATAVTTELDSILNDPSFLRKKVLTYEGVGIEIIDCTVSSDLRHANVMWNIPYTCPDGYEDELGDELEESLNGGGGRLLQSSLANRLMKQFSLRLRFVRDKDNGVNPLDLFLEELDRIDEHGEVREEGK